MSREEIKKNLNTEQEKAVLTSDGPVLIVAGAGSGKTLVLSHRIAHLMEKGASPGSILAITFTNKAAEEMRNRINSLIPNSKFLIPNGPWVGTFHAFAAYILRDSGQALGISKNFSILDEEDSLSLIKETMAELEIDPNPPAGRAGKFEARKIRAIISRKKNELLARGGLEAGGNYFQKIILKIWERYEEKLKTAKALDFDDLLLKAVQLFSKHPEVLEKWQERFRYIHIDEYQDTNLVQYHLAHMLAAKYKNICVVGDVDQAIYSWRGADFRNILHFERDWPEAKIITLEENYRSTQLILNAANAVIVKNKARIAKNLFSRKSTGPKITIFEAANEEEEAQFIAELVKNLAAKIPLREIAVLYRTNFQSRILEEKMLERNIPYQVIGVKFYERKEIKDVLAYLRASLNPDDFISVRRIINLPPRGIGKVLVAKFLAGDKLKAAEEEKISEFKKILERAQKELRLKKASEAVKSVIRESGLEEYFDDGTEEGEMRTGNIKELVSLAKRYDELNPPEGILKLLEDAALMSDEDTIKKEENSVKLMTVHAAKGLEFKIVFIAGLEEGLFPHRSLSEEDEELRQEEERRLFYVALTRAKEKIFLSWTVFRTIFGERRINAPSSFLSDIPEEFIERAEEISITLE